MTPRFESGTQALPATTHRPTTTLAILTAARLHEAGRPRAQRLQPGRVVDLHLIGGLDGGLGVVRAARATEQVVAGVVPRTLRGRLPVERSQPAVVGEV